MPLPLHIQDMCQKMFEQINLLQHENANSTIDEQAVGGGVVISGVVISGVDRKRIHDLQEIVEELKRNNAVRKSAWSSVLFVFYWPLPSSLLPHNHHVLRFYDFS